MLLLCRFNQSVLLNLFGNKSSRTRRCSLVLSFITSRKCRQSSILILIIGRGRGTVSSKDDSYWIIGRGRGTVSSKDDSDWIIGRGGGTVSSKDDSDWIIGRGRGAVSSKDDSDWIIGRAGAQSVQRMTVTGSKTNIYLRFTFQ